MTVSVRRALLAVLLVAISGSCAITPSLARRLDIRASHPNGKTQPLTIVVAPGKAARFQVEFVDSDPGRERGLMFRKSLAPNAGMLFDFKTPQEVNFWMKNTLIPLDMLFIGQDGRIKNIYRQATPQSLTPIPSDGPVRGVLEIAGGRALELDLEPGDCVRHHIFQGC